MAIAGTMDKVNQEILIALQKNGRYSYNKLAQKLGIKAITVAKRVETMLRDDVIAINAVPNPDILGYKVQAVICLDVEIPELDGVCSRLVNNPNISSVSTTFGRYDLIIFAEYRDFEMLNKLVREEIANIKGIKSIETFIISDTKKRYAGVFSTNSRAERPIAVDEIDEALISELRTNGRATFIALADKLDISPATVSRRVDYLTRKKAIQITVVPNPTKMGRSVVAFLGLQVDLKKINEICTRLSSFPQVPTVLTLLNGYNILTVVTEPNLQELFKFITNEIAVIRGVQNIETLIRAEFRKRTYLGFDLEERLHHLLDDNADLYIK